MGRQHRSDAWSCQSNNLSPQTPRFRVCRASLESASYPDRLCLTCTDAQTVRHRPPPFTGRGRTSQGRVHFVRTPQSVCGRTGGRRSQPGEQGGQCERTGRLAQGCLSPMLARPGAGNLASMLRGREQGRLGGTWAGHRGGRGTFRSGSPPAPKDLTAPSLLGSAFIPGDLTAGTGPGRAG